MPSRNYLMLRSPLKAGVSKHAGRRCKQETLQTIRGRPTALYAAGFLRSRTTTSTRATSMPSGISGSRTTSR